MLGSLSPSKLTAAAAASLVPWALGGCGSRCANSSSVAPGVAVAPAAPESASPGKIDDAGGHGEVAPVASEDSSRSVAGGRGVVVGGVRWLGRVDATHPNAVKFGWSATGFVATVSGTRISVKLQTEGVERAFFQPVIDGKEGPRFQVAGDAAQTVTLADGLRPGNHTVELYRETEGMYGYSVFTGFVDGAVKGAPTASGRLIEIIGDSISAGYGNLGTEVHPPWDNTCSFSLETQSAYQSYGAMIGRSLNAEVSIVARSGWGMYRDGNGDTSAVLRSVYADTLGTQGSVAWDFRRKADAVVINLGTNDSNQGDPGKPYEDAYVAFFRTVRGHHPGAWIFLTIGPMTSDPPLAQMRAHLNHVAKTLADPRVVVVEMPVQDATSTGCDYHPNVAEDAKMAGVLATAIREKLGW